MHAVRHLLAQRYLAVLICAATLLLKLVVPTGYMINTDHHGRVAVIICPGTVPAVPVMKMPDMTMPAMKMAGAHGDMADHGKSTDHAAPEMPCAFAGLSAAALGAVDPVQLALLIAFVLAVGTAATVSSAPSAPANLRPPLRGPPAYL